jgi:hypothetical protein
MHGARAPIAADAGDQAGTIGARSGSPIVVEVQRDECGHAMGALQLPVSSAVTIERDGAGNIIGVVPRDV